VKINFDVECLLIDNTLNKLDLIIMYEAWSAGDFGKIPNHILCYTRLNKNKKCVFVVFSNNSFSMILM